MRKIYRVMLQYISVALPLTFPNFSEAENNNVPANEIKQNVQNFSIKLATNRVIYYSKSSGATLAIVNEHNYPMLVKSQTYKEDKSSAAPFVITPPLFRIDAKQQSKLKIVKVNDNDPEDKETLYWLCVTGVPPKMGDAWADGEIKKGKNKEAVLNIQVSMRGCIKLISRPSSLNGTPSDYVNDISWEKGNGEIIAKNNSPFYMNLSGIKLDGKPLGNIDYIPPFETKKFKTENTNFKSIEWVILADYGGEVRAIKNF